MKEIYKLQKSNFKFYLADVETALDIPFFKGGIHAGFPSPADDYTGDKIDLNKRLIKHPSSTFFGIVQGDSMEQASIHDGDLVIIDRQIHPFDGMRILCCIDGEFTIKYIRYDDKDKDIIWLVAANPKYKPIKVTKQDNFLVWGVVTYTITPHNDSFK